MYGSCPMGDSPIDTFPVALRKATISVMIPPPKQRGATVLVNGSARQLRVQGNPTWRTVIQVDGVTVYNKFPSLYGKRDIKFDFIPGKPAQLRWYKTTAHQLEFRVTVDGATTKLASLDSVAVTNTRRRFEQRAAGVFLLALAVFSFYMNRHSLLASNQYYPKALGITPLLFFGGLASLFYPSILHPAIKKPPQNKATQIIVGIVGLAIVVLGFTLFTDRFLATFSPQ
jgi:hypothetical protein